MNRFILAAAICLLVAIRPAGAVDLNGNQQSDIWEAMFAATNLGAATDSDGDGAPNLAEGVAGTDPYNPLSFPAVGLQTGTGTVQATWGSWAGKWYTLEAADAPGATWVVITNVPGTNAQQLAAINLGNLTQRMFRVRISDVFADASGLSDWEKLQAGLSLTNSFSNGQFDPQGNAISDYAYVTSQLAQQSVLSIVASDINATQPDPGGPVQDSGSFTILRGGFAFRSITGSVALTGTAVEGVDYTNLPHTFTLPAGVVAQTVVLTPLANTNRKSSALCTMGLQPGAGFAVGGPSNASVVVWPSATPAGIGLYAQFWDYTNSPSVYPTGAPVVVETGIYMGSRIDPVVDITWGGTNLPVGMATTLTFSARWSGQVQPQYSEPYYFNVNGNAGTRLWVNDQLIIDGWGATGDRTSAPIDLIGGVRYNIKLEYWEGSGSAYTKLYWYSPSQPKQIIPSNRLYPTNAVPAAPPAVVNIIEATAILGYPFTNTVAVNNGATLVSVGPMPPGLTFTPTNRLIAGVPTKAGRFPILILATNAVGSSQSVLDLTVLDTGAVITREVWTNVPGIAITNIPVGTAAVTGQLATLEGPTNFGDNYAQRWRGYLTAPLTGNYYFWIAAGDAAELWLANDEYQVTKVRRCWVNPTTNAAPPPANGTPSRSWTNQPNQKSPWLALEAGKRYYIEVLHKAGVGSNDNVAVGWVRPDQTNALPADVIPGQVLSPYIPAVANSSSGTLYTATMLAQGGVVSYGFGTATLRLSADESRATVRLGYTNLTSAATGIHIHAEAYLTNASAQLLFSLTGAAPQPDGSYEWPVQAVGTLSAADVREVVKQGKTYLDIHTTNYPLGEIRGNFTLAVGSSSFVPPPAPPAWADDSATTNGAVRFLNQATFGPAPADIAAVRSMGYEAWIDDQFNKPFFNHLPTIISNKTADPQNFYTGNLMWNSWWEKALVAPDQLRQRVAFALSEILVISDVGTLNNNARAQAHYYDVLLTNAFGNFRQLLEDVTLTPGMGLYLDMRGNAKGSIISGTHPNENYAREILQLFSVGLYRLWPDGTFMMNTKGDLVPTYDQKEILGYSAVFTGWNYYQAAQTNGRLPSNWYPGSNYTNFMVQVPSQHDRDAKRVLDNIVLPPAAGNQTNSAAVEYDSYALNDLEQALDVIFQNENCGPYICRQLIQRLVTSHPSRDYVYRVVQKFNDNGSGVRGDLKAVIKAILLDREARDPAMLNVATFGKQRENLLRITALGRAFPAPSNVVATYTQTGTAAIAVTFPSPHRLATGDRTLFSFDSGSPLPTFSRYDVTVTSSNTLTINDANLIVCTYAQSNGTAVVTFVNHYLQASNRAYLRFTTGGATSGVYEVFSAVNNSFTVRTGDTNARSGQVVIPRINGGFTVSGYSVGSTTNVIRFYPNQYSQMTTGDQFQAVFYSGIATDGVYVVSSNVDLKTFVVQTGGQSNDSDSSVYLYPLSDPPLNRSGSLTVQYSTYRMDSTDTALMMTPMNSPTVFNFYFPDYKFAGALAAAGLTTPEFQLTSDSGVANVNNFIAGGILNSQSTNTAGLCSFRDGGEAITLDLGPWTSTNYASNTGVPMLFDQFNSLLCAGQLTVSAKTSIVAFVASTNVTYSSPTPTSSQIRDRIRATLHLIVTSPGYAIQK